MTHDELLAKIDEKGNHPFATLQYNEVGQTDIQAAFSALRAVVELHKPDEIDRCIGCDRWLVAGWEGNLDNYNDWNHCHTIQAIKKELQNGSM